jgi:hydrogenase/urease accessory protein HupE
MNIFEKICMVVTIPVGAIFMVLGVIGLFVGCNAHFTLPPILGVLPFFLGFAMFVCLVRYWKLCNKLSKAIRDSRRLAKNRWE